MHSTLHSGPVTLIESATLSINVRAPILKIGVSPKCAKGVHFWSFLLLCTGQVLLDRFYKALLQNTPYVPGTLILLCSYTTVL